MSAIEKFTYDEACKRLFALVPCSTGGKHSREESFAQMQHYATLLGLDFEHLRIIHVAGTKGKGSTCSMCESILRHEGLKTGLLTSPHLVCIRERIRINGKCIDELSFADMFSRFWKRLYESKAVDSVFPRIPSFFRFVTLLALAIFIEERVDVAVIEVGIGGRLDSTNVVPSPVVCGITALDMDHVRILGNTLAKIAFEKAGILKPGTCAFTVKQEEEAMTVLLAVAAGNNVPLRICDDVCDEVAVGIAGRCQRQNAGLAVCICDEFLRRVESFTGDRCGILSKEHCDDHKDPLEASPEIITNNCFESSLEDRLATRFALGLAAVSWPGRAHVHPDPSSASVTYFLDGAHTPLSVQYAALWFQNCLTRCDEGSVVLMFNCSPERDIVALLSLLTPITFDAVIFCQSDVKKPLFEPLPDIRELVAAAFATTRSSDVSHATDSFPHHPCRVEPSLQWQHTMKAVWEALVGDSGCILVMEDAGLAMKWLRHRADHHPQHVLVTGSLYLVGSVLNRTGWKPC